MGVIGNWLVESKENSKEHRNIRSKEQPLHPQTWGRLRKMPLPARRSPRPHGRGLARVSLDGEVAEQPQAEPPIFCSRVTWEAIHRERLPLWAHSKATKRVQERLFTGRSHTGRPPFFSWGKQENHSPGGARQVTRKAANSGLWGRHACTRGRLELGKPLCGLGPGGNHAVGI